jgi:hypothetical protein
MKGIVFTEFMEMLDEKFGPEQTERLLEACPLPSGGSYTSVGTYDHQELFALVQKLSEDTGIPVPDLVRTFGRHLFNRFVVMYPAFFKGVDSAFQFLELVDQHVHVEVRKLYPDAELPHFATERIDGRTLVLDYRSARALGDFAEGLIQGCADHFGEQVEIRQEPLAGGPGTAIRFLITRLE